MAGIGASESSRETEGGGADRAESLAGGSAWRGRGTSGVEDCGVPNP